MRPAPVPGRAFVQPSAQRPFAGREGKYVTTRQLRNRLYKELQTDVSLKVEPTDSMDSFKVSGRGELHISVLIENMRRQGYEFQISKPEVLFKYEDNKKLEPMEKVTIDISSEYIGSIIEKLGSRKGELIHMQESSGGYARLIFNIPARGLIGYTQEFMSDTKGNGIMNSSFEGYDSYKGPIPRRTTGSLIAFETGEATTYGLHSASVRGTLFIGPGRHVYEGMIIGASPKNLDIEVNVNRKKQLTNVRASGSDDAQYLSPPRIMSLEESLEFIKEDELIEVTPKSFRLRKRILNAGKRHKARNK